MADEAMIEAQDLTKHFGSFVAVSDLTFSIPAGQIVAFLGPNAAGKSTTMRMLTGFLAPTSGVARVAGLDVATDRITAAERIGYLPENGPLYMDMTPEDILDFFGRARGMGRRQLDEGKDRVIDLCGLGDVMGKRVSKLSRGYRQRVGLANALLHEPDVLILDEPTSGLDPNQAAEVRTTLERIGRQKTILYSTHVLPEVHAIAGRVLLIANGRLVFDGTPAEFAGRGGDDGIEGAFRALTRTPEEPVVAGSSADAGT